MIKRMKEKKTSTPVSGYRRSGSKRKDENS
jgi:hypothetical protein